MSKWHQKRMRAEKRFRFYGIAALGLAVLVLVSVLGTITLRGYTGFVQTRITLPITFDAEMIGIEAGTDIKTMPVSGFNRLTQHAIKNLFPAVTEPGQQRLLTNLI